MSFWQIGSLLLLIEWITFAVRYVQIRAPTIISEQQNVEKCRLFLRLKCTRRRCGALRWRLHPLSLYSGLAYRRNPEARRAAELEETAAPAAVSAAAASGAPIGAQHQHRPPQGPSCRLLPPQSTQLHADAASLLQKANQTQIYTTFYFSLSHNSFQTHIAVNYFPSTGWTKTQQGLLLKLWWTAKANFVINRESIISFTCLFPGPVFLVFLFVWLPSRPQKCSFSKDQNSWRENHLAHSCCRNLQKRFCTFSSSIFIKTL